MAETENGKRELSYVLAVKEAVETILNEDPDAFVAGEDVAGAGSVFGIYRGLLDEFGPERIVNTPISEEGIIGLGVGAAAAGLRPIVDIMFMDFLGECMDEVTNQMAKMRYMFGGRATLPITITTMCGARNSMAAQHSQCLESWICHIPGLKVVMPSTPHDAKGLLIAASRDDNPVFVVMNKASLALTGEVPEEAYTVAHRRGKHRAAGHGLHHHQLQPYGPRVRKRRRDPCGTGRRHRSDRPALAAAAWTRIRSSLQWRRPTMPWSFTRRCVSAVWAARSPRRCRSWRSTISTPPSAGVGAPFSPVPFSPSLEQSFVPNADKIVASATELLGL